MRKLFLIGVIGLALAGCNVNLNPNVATPSQVSVAINAFDAAEATAANYLTLPLCGGANKVCRTAATSSQITVAVRAGRTARDQLTQDLQANVSTPVTLLQTLTTAVSTLQALNAQ